jgi:penicillin-binding protein-related factor A (putative recombinase)
MTKLCEWFVLSWFFLTKILSAIKEGQQKYCETVYPRSGINHMWILKNSQDLLDNLKSRSFSQVSSIKDNSLDSLPEGMFKEGSVVS